MVCKFWLAPVTLAANHGFSWRETVVIRSRLLEAWDEHCGCSDARIKSIEVSDEMITARLVDGRIISVPFAWSWRLSAATPAQRANYQIIGDGHGVHRPDVDEDLSAAGMLNGDHAPPRRDRA